MTRRLFAVLLNMRDLLISVVAVPVDADTHSCCQTDRGRRAVNHWSSAPANHTESFGRGESAGVSPLASPGWGDRRSDICETC